MDEPEKSMKDSSKSPAMDKETDKDLDQSLFRPSDIWNPNTRITSTRKNKY